MKLIVAEKITVTGIVQKLKLQIHDGESLLSNIQKVMVRAGERLICCTQNATGADEKERRVKLVLVFSFEVLLKVSLILNELNAFGNCNDECFKWSAEVLQRALNRSHGEGEIPRRHSLEGRGIREGEEGGHLLKDRSLEEQFVKKGW
ncbi:uncharacterized protein V6R79_004277 [Siganus canaliculatus]